MQEVLEGIPIEVVQEIIKVHHTLIPANKTFPKQDGCMKAEVENVAVVDMTIIMVIEGMVRLYASSVMNLVTKHNFAENTIRKRKVIMFQLMKITTHKETLRGDDLATMSMKESSLRL